jgi:hypothetical protein
MGLISLILLEPPKCCGKSAGPARARLKLRWLEQRKIYYARGPAPWISPKMAPALQLKDAEFLCFRMWKQTRGKDADMAVSLSLGGYNISH